MRINRTQPPSNRATHRRMSKTMRSEIIFANNYALADSLRCFGESAAQIPKLSRAKAWRATIML